MVKKAILDTQFVQYNKENDQSAVRIIVELMIIIKIACKMYLVILEGIHLYKLKRYGKNIPIIKHSNLQ